MKTPAAPPQDPLTGLPRDVLQREVVQIEDAALLGDRLAQELRLVLHVPLGQLQRPERGRRLFSVFIYIMGVLTYIQAVKRAF